MIMVANGKLVTHKGDMNSEMMYSLIGKAIQKGLLKYESKPFKIEDGQKVFIDQHSLVKKPIKAKKPKVKGRGFKKKKVNG